MGIWLDECVISPWKAPVVHRFLTNYKGEGVKHSLSFDISQDLHIIHLINTNTKVICVVIKYENTSDLWIYKSTLYQGKKKIEKAAD